MRRNAFVGNEKIVFILDADASLARVIKTNPGDTLPGEAIWRKKNHITMYERKR